VISQAWWLNCNVRGREAKFQDYSGLGLPCPPVQLRVAKSGMRKLEGIGFGVYLEPGKMGSFIEISHTRSGSVFLKLSFLDLDTFLFESEAESGIVPRAEPQA